MENKIKRTIRKNKKSIIIILILWIIFTMILVAPVAKSIVDSTIDGKVDLGKCMESLGEEISSFSSIFRILKKEYFSTFFKIEIQFTIVFAIFTAVGLFRSAPKNAYTDIEHGSSDWSAGGEQYKILDKSKGIILAEKNYLPTNKRGNVNVLVVGRIRIR